MANGRPSCEFADFEVVDSAAFVLACIETGRFDQRTKVEPMTGEGIGAAKSDWTDDVGRICAGDFCRQRVVREQIVNELALYLDVGVGGVEVVDNLRLDFNLGWVVTRAQAAVPAHCCHTLPDRGRTGEECRRLRGRTCTLGRRLRRRAARRTRAGSCRRQRACARGGSGSRGWSARCRWSGRAWRRRRCRGGACCGEQRRNGDRRNSKPGCLHRSPRGWVVDGAVDSRGSVVGNLLSGAGAGNGRLTDRPVRWSSADVDVAFDEIAGAVATHIRARELELVRHRWNRPRRRQATPAGAS